MKRLAAMTVAVLLGTAAAADAHIQVRPAEAAPLDPVLWTVLVPNEGQDRTRRVELQVPAGVIPFSYEDQPGWERTLKLRPDQSVERIVWEGELAPDGLAELSFLATTPEREGRIAWKALQVYQGGAGEERVVRWIGDEGADEPASFTTISAGAPRQDAGGEGAGAAPAAPVAAARNTRVAAATTGDAEGRDALPIALAATALAVALAALVVAVRKPRPVRTH